MATIEFQALFFTSDTLNQNGNLLDTQCICKDTQTAVLPPTKDIPKIIFIFYSQIYQQVAIIHCCRSSAIGLCSMYSISVIHGRMNIITTSNYRYNSPTENATVHFYTTLINSQNFTRIANENRYVYDIYSDTVITAARITSYCERDKNNVFEEFMQAVMANNHLPLRIAPRSEIHIKGKGIMKKPFFGAI